MHLCLFLMGSAARPVLLAFPDGRTWVLQDLSPARKAALSEQRVCTGTATSPQPGTPCQRDTAQPPAAPGTRRKEPGAVGAVQGGVGSPAKGRCRLRWSSSSCTVPELWKPERFQAAVVLATPAKFLCKERGEQQLCSPSSSVNLAASTDLPQPSLLFEVINDVFNNSRGRVYTDLAGKVSSTHMSGSPQQSVNPPGGYL